MKIDRVVRLGVYETLIRDAAAEQPHTLTRAYEKITVKGIPLANRCYR